MSASIDSVIPTVATESAPSFDTQKMSAIAKTDSMTISATMGIARRMTARPIEPSVKSWCEPRTASRNVVQTRAAPRGWLRTASSMGGQASTYHFAIQSGNLTLNVASGDLTLFRERLSEVLDQFLGRFEADGHPHETVGDPEAGPVLAGHAGVRRQSRLRQERLDPSEGGRLDRQLGRGDEPLRRTGPAGQLVAQHSAEAFEETFRAVVARMTFEPGIVHTHDLAPPLEEPRYLERALVLIAHAYEERLDPAVQEERRVRIERASQMIELALDPLDVLAAAHDRAGDDVGMSVHVLRAAVDGEIEPVLQRPEVDGRRERVVDDRDEAAFSRELGD